MQAVNFLLQQKVENKKFYHYKSYCITFTMQKENTQYIQLNVILCFNTTFFFN